MGCAAYHRLATEHELLAQKMTKVIQDKEMVYSDKILLESEIAQLKKNFYEALNDSEKMKKEIDLYQSTEYPEIFESGYSDGNLISDWLEIDLREGDRLLDALGVISPGFLPEIQKLRSRSALLSRDFSTLRDYLNYFVRRYDLFNNAWRELLSSQKQVEHSVQHLKTELANGIQGVESFLGKRGEAANELIAEFRKTCEMPSSEFLVEQRNIAQKLNNIRKDMMNKKLEEKDQERHRVVNLLEGEIAKLNNKHALERESFDREKKSLREQHDSDLRSLRAQLSAEFEAKLTKLSVPKVELEESVRKEFQQRFDQCAADAEVLKERLRMMAEELASAAVRHQSESETIQSVLTDEIEQRVNEMKELRDMNKHEKAIAALKHYEEISTLKKECESLRKELQGYSHSSTEETERLRQELAGEINQRKRLEEELGNRDQMLTELRQDFIAKSDSQKAFFDEKIASERSKHASELQAAEGQVAALTRELAQQELMQRDLLASLSKSQDMSKLHALSGLIAKVELSDIESAGKIREVMDRCFSLEKEEIEDKETLVLALLAKVSQAEKALRIGEQQPLYEESIAALRYTHEHTDSALKLLESEVLSLQQKLMSAESLSGELNTQIAEQQGQIADLEVKIQLLRKEQMKERKHERSQSEQSVQQSELIQRYQEDLSHRDAKIKELAELQRSQELETQSVLHKQRLRSSAVLLSTHVYGLMRVAVAVWKAKSGKVSVMNSPRMDISPQVLQGRVSFPAATSELELLFAEDKRLLFEKTSLAGLFRAVSRTEAPLLPQQTFKLMDEIMERKMEADILAMQKRRKPKAVPVFALDHLRRTIGNQKLAQKTLGQALICLLRNMREGQLYAELFCKLLNVGVSDPISLELSVFLVKIRSDVGKFVNNFNRELPEKRTVHEFEGGSMFLVDVISYLYDLFETDLRAGELALKLIRPPDIRLEDYVLFKICHKMAKSGVNAEGTFELMDRNHSGVLERAEFIDSIRKTLQLWISAEDIDSAFSAIADGQQVLKKSVFLDRLNFKQYLVDALSEKFSISRAKFLMSLVEVHYQREKEIASELLERLGTQTPLAYSTFVSMAETLDPELPAERMQALWHLAEELSLPSDVTPRAMVRALLKHRVHPYSLSPYCEIHSDESHFDPTVEPLIDDNAEETSGSNGDLELSQLRSESYFKGLSDSRFSV